MSTTDGTPQSTPQNHDLLLWISDSQNVGIPNKSMGGREGMSTLPLLEFTLVALTLLSHSLLHRRLQCQPLVNPA
jgi:hypothetical protein